MQPVKIPNIAQNTPDIDALDKVIDQAEAERSTDAVTDDQLADLTFAYHNEITTFRQTEDATAETFYQAIDQIDAAQQERFRNQ
jgi:hypothetical protein